jgi:hypothetical protein
MLPINPVPNRPQKSSKSTKSTTGSSGSSLLSVDAETAETLPEMVDVAAVSPEASSEMSPETRPEPAPIDDIADAPKLVRPVARPPAELPVQVAIAEPAVAVAVETETELDPVSLLQKPIPAPSEPMQYRAIGLVRGIYTPSEEQFTRGNMKTEDGHDVEAVLLGRVMSLVKNHLALEKEHLWVVYPRTREREGTLHLQIVGVWEPENLNQSPRAVDGVILEDQPPMLYQPSSEVKGDQFSIRGEIIYYSEEDRKTVIKIRQIVRKKQQEEEPKAFKLNLEGVVSGHKTIGYFWDLQVCREDQALVIKSSNLIAIVPPFKGPKRKRFFGGPGGGGGFRRPGGPPGAGGGGFRRPGGSGGPSGPPGAAPSGAGGTRPGFRGAGGTRPPFRSEGGDTPPVPSGPVSKPVKKKDRPVDAESTPPPTTEPTS